MMKWLLPTIFLALVLAGGSMISRMSPSFGRSATATAIAIAKKNYHLPRPDHVVVVWEENKTFDNIIDNPDAPYINHLAQQGALMTRAYAVAHPSQPNYLASFSGSTHGVQDDGCQYHFSGPNLAASLAAADRTFTLYAQGLPRAGYAGCRDGAYRRKHNPVADYSTLPMGDSRPFSHLPRDFARLPTVAWVVPDTRHDMHSGSVRSADRWLKRNIQPFVAWARSHNSLLIITWDEDDYAHHNHIPVILVGPMVHQGHNDQIINHFSILRTVETMYGLPSIGGNANVPPVTGIWRR